MSHAPENVNLDPCPVHLIDTSPSAVQNNADLLLGWKRYEKARKLSPAEWTRLHTRNLAGESFDSMIDALPEASTPVPEAAPLQQLIDWTVERWNAEVKHRPMVNIHRRSLDGTWRRVLRHLGVDDRERLGPTHDELRAEIGSREWEAMNGKAAPVLPQPIDAPEGYKLVMVPDEPAPDEPDWDECKRQAEVSTGLKVEQHTFSILKREVRRWIAHKATAAPVQQEAEKWFAVLTPSRAEGVIFKDKGDARYAATGKYGSKFGVPTIASEFRDSYGEAGKLETIEVAALQPTQGASTPLAAGREPVAIEDLALLDRSLQIADAAMFDVLQHNCVDQDGHGLVLGLTNASASEVSELAEADDLIREAFDWLHGRGYVALGRDGLGEHIIVERRPGEQ